MVLPTLAGDECSDCAVQRMVPSEGGALHKQYRSPASWRLGRHCSSRRAPALEHPSSSYVLQHPRPRYRRRITFSTMYGMQQTYNAVDPSAQVPPHLVRVPLLLSMLVGVHGHG